MATSKSKVSQEYKAIITGCRCCGTLKRYILKDTEAGYVEAQFLDKSEFLTFRAYDMSALDLAEGGVFSQTLVRADIHSLQVYPLTPEEVSALTAAHKKELKRIVEGRPLAPPAPKLSLKAAETKLQTSSIGLSTLLGGAK